MITKENMNPTDINSVWLAAKAALVEAQAAIDATCADCGSEIDPELHVRQLCCDCDLLVYGARVCPWGEE